MTTTVRTIDYIVSDPAIRSGSPCLRGTGLRVSDVVAPAFFHGQSPDEIALGFEISLAAVYAALSYFYDHQEEIRADWERDSSRIEEAKRKAQNG
mgnify:CR=1 FL=1